MEMYGGFLVTKIKQLSDRVFERVLDARNIDSFNGPQGRILYVLWQGDGIPIKTISEKCGLAMTSLTTMLERMEKQGLIRRIQSESDKRKTLIHLTGRARSLEKDYRAVSVQMGGIFYDGFSPDEITQFELFLERIRENLERWQEI